MHLQNDDAGARRTNQSFSAHTNTPKNGSIHSTTRLRRLSDAHLLRDSNPVEDGASIGNAGAIIGAAALLEMDRGERVGGADGPIVSGVWGPSPTPDPELHNAVVAAGLMRRMARKYSSRTGHSSEPDAGIKYSWEAAPRGNVSSIFAPSASSPRASDGRVLSVGAPGSRDAASSPLAEDAFGEEGPPMLEDSAHKKLDQLRATAIAGNDISSSCLYAAGITVQAAGILAPVSTLLVVLVLYLYRAIYGEVGTALPMNGGTYNALLNTAPKRVAALAGLLSLLSYIATATSSASSAAAYVNYEWPEIPLTAMSIGILVFFALLNLLGVSESANVATFLFIIHIGTVVALMIGGFVFMVRNDFKILIENFGLFSHTYLTNATTAASQAFNGTELAHLRADPKGSWFKDLIYGFFAAAVGITGFESAANYIEEQKEGVYLKVLRNLWLLVFLINPAIIVITLGVLPMPVLFDDADFSLAKVGEQAIGPWMRTLTVVDAGLVLSGAVLTAYVGVGGLLQRMTLDAIIPRVFLQQNKCRGSFHVIILTFCFLCCALRLMVGSNLQILTSVYSIAFLGVMCLFAVSCMILKQKRNTLKRDTKAPVGFVIVAFLTMFLGLIGDLTKEQSVIYFMYFFSLSGAVMVVFMLRCEILKWTAVHMEKVQCLKKPAGWLQKSAARLRRQRIVFFSTSPDIAFLNKIIGYIAANEDGRDIYIVYCVGEDAEIGCRKTLALDAQFETACATLDMIHPRITINCVRVQRAFDPATVEEVSRVLRVPINFMFLGCPKKKFFPQFVGMRVITHYRSKEQLREGKAEYESAVLPTKVLSAVPNVTDTN